jgi:hypothetical protein
MNTREAERLRNGNELGRGGDKVKAVGFRSSEAEKDSTARPG